MRIKILTLFPEMFDSVLSSSILGRARKHGLLDIELINIRDYTTSKHNNADDYPFGGGAGMVMLPQPIVDAIEKNREPGMRSIYLSPRGRTLTQRVVEEYAKCDSLLFLCGHYEGVDQRALDLCIDEELSVGDYVLTGGELGAMIAVDAVSRLVPGVLGSAESGEDESFSTGLLEYPQYTRPAEFRGMRVPEVLLGGNHADICAWRRHEALEITRRRRTDLLQSAPLDDEDRLNLQRMEKADAQLEALSRFGVRARRMELFAEKAYGKAWFMRFVPENVRASAKKQCFSGRRHVGWLYQAFEMGFAPCASGDEARDMLLACSGAAVLYLNREGIAIELEDCGALTEIPRYSLLSASDHTWTIACSGKGVLYAAQKLI